MIEWLFVAFLGFVLNAVVGTIVLSYVDRDGRLLAWAREAPSGLGWTVIVFWFVVVIAYYWRKGEE